MNYFAIAVATAFFALWSNMGIAQDFDISSAVMVPEHDANRYTMMPMPDIASAVIVLDTWSGRVKLCVMNNQGFVCSADAIQLGG